MRMEVSGTDEWGSEAYRKLFEDIMSDIGKSSLIDTAVLVLRAEIPFFVFSVKLRAEPSSRTVSDVASLRQEGSTVHLSITDEKYAPEILAQLWKRYGRGSVVQQTRFDLDAENAEREEVGSLVVSSGDEFMQEIIGAVWRIMPEGIKARHSFSNGDTMTIMATEEIIQPYMMEEALKIHRALLEREASDV
ncbi:MAG: methanogenesis marker 17 protein [Candidatus Methanomethylophilaceae archaeon]|nr:methanogenesis marker 17 protein [Candidatus Methanomethylophilaceae archaeon]NLF33706.1 methanogenesis marker 17 protein [Thermoplasmatales archaeon]